MTKVEKAVSRSSLVETLVTRQETISRFRSTAEFTKNVCTVSVLRVSLTVRKINSNIVCSL